MADTVPAPETINVTRWQTLLYSSINAKCIRTTKQLHACGITSGLFLSPKSTHLLSLLASAYALGGQIVTGRYLFDKSPERTFVSYKTMIRVCAEDGSSHKALKLFAEMLESGRYKPDNYTFPFVIRACGDSSLSQLGSAVHGLALVNGYGSDTFTANSLLAMYMNVGDSDRAKRVLNTMGEPTIVSWKTMIRACAEDGSSHKALRLFAEMLELGRYKPDNHTFPFVIRACGDSLLPQLGSAVHGLALVSGYGSDTFIANSLLAMYVNVGDSERAKRVFDTMGEPTIFSWNIMIRACAEDGSSHKALRLFAEMLELGRYKPDNHTFPFVIRACGDSLLPQLGSAVHGLALVSGYGSDTFIANSLLAMYMNVGDSERAKQVFDTMGEPTIFSWNTMIRACAEDGSSHKALRLFTEMLELGRYKPDNHTFPFVIRACGDSLLHQLGSAVHGLALVSGYGSDTFIANSLLAMYMNVGDSERAKWVFDTMGEPTIFSWNTMIRVCAEEGSLHKALKLFAELLESGRYKPDNYTFPFVIRACGDSLLPQLGSAVHGLALVSGYGLDTFTANSLLAMYMNVGDSERAKRVFDTMGEPTIVSWNTMISGYFRNDCAKEALMLFRKMMDVGVEANAATVVSVLPACGILKDLELGREVHLLVEKQGLGNTVSVRNALVDMYVKCGKMDEARSVFDEIIEKDVVTWTTMIHGYSLNGDVRSALGLCRLMQFKGVKPNAVTLASLLASCASLPNLKLGKCLHGWALMQRLESDANVETALINLYARCKCMRLSFKVFFKTYKTRTVPWNVILSGCIYNKLAEEAIELFREMLLEGVKPNDATFKSLFRAFAVQADMQQAMSLHSYLTRSGFISRTDIATGLVRIYCKCGNLNSGHGVFSGVLSKKRDIVLWSSLIAGYSTHGRGEIALSLFYDMVQSGIRPNEVTLTSVLHACSHAGMVDDGLSLFNFIYGSFPSCLRTNHYTCMVDLLGRAGRLEEAHELIKSMPFQPSHTVWGALLGACVVHENVELGEEAAKWLLELEPENTGNYVGLGRWKDAENVRHRMNEVGLLKSPAQSVIEVRKPV